MLLAAFIESAVTQLSSIYSLAEARSMVIRLCEERLGVKSYTYVVEPNYYIDENKSSILREDMSMLLKSMPLQYVLGFEEFCGRRFKLSPSVLIPRPETELLVEEARHYLEPKSRVLDLCTGSGCIAWTLAMDVPGCSVVAVDVSGDALTIARSQFLANAKDDYGSFIPPCFIQADVLANGEGFNEGLFDLVVSNPPYIMDMEKSNMRSNVLDYEPALALFVPNDDPLLFYRAIVQWIQKFLKPSGVAIVEINEVLGPQTMELFTQTGYGQSKILKDLSGKDRFVLIKS